MEEGSIGKARGRGRILDHWPAVVCFAATTLLHLILALRFPLAEDETYYWEWSRRLDWGYYDQGPLIAWSIRAGCVLFGETQIGVRFGTLVAALATQVLLYVLANDLFGKRIALLSSIALAVTPLALAGGFLATYDPLLIALWSGGLLAARNAIHRKSNVAWLALGVCFGIGMLAKYTMALFGVCVLLYLVVDPVRRRWLLKPQPWTALAIGILIWTPNIIWLANHDAITLGHMGTLATSSQGKPFWSRTAEFLGSQAVILGPVMFVGLVASAVASIRKLASAENRFLFWLGAPVLLFFVALTFRSKVLANWAAAGWLTPTIIFAGLSQTPRRPWLWTMVVAIATSSLIAVVGTFPEGAASIGIRVPLKWSEQVNRMYGGRELAEAVDAQRRRMEAESGELVTVGATTYQDASRLAFYLPDQPEAACLFLGTRANQYVLWDRLGYPPEGGAMVAVSEYPNDSKKRRPFEAVFERIEPIPEPVRVFREGVYGEPVRFYYLYRCYGFRLAALPPMKLSSAPRRR